MANLNLVTGFRKQNHVTSDDQRALNAAVFGKNSFVIDGFGKEFNLEILNNNQVRLYSGDGIMQGAHFRLTSSEYVDLDVSNGVEGYNRNDLVVARYSKNETTGIEEVNAIVIKGTPTEGTAADPATQSGTIIDAGDAVTDFPLWRLPIKGLQIGTPIKLFNTENQQLGSYPVGSIFESRNSTSPASQFGGTWTLLENIENKYYRWMRVDGDTSTDGVPTFSKINTDLNEINTDLTERITGYGNAKVLTLPYTAEFDGILVVDITSSTTGQGFMYAQCGAFVLRILTAVGYSASGSIPVKKGSLITIENSGNISAYTFTFVPFAF